MSYCARLLAISLVVAIPLWLTAGAAGPSSPAPAIAAAVVAVNTTSQGLAATAGANRAAASGTPAGNSSETGAPLSLPPTTLPDLSGGSGFDGGSLLSLAGKFGIVLILLFVCLRVLKAVMPGGRQPGMARNNPMLLHSENLGDKHRVCLLDLGGSVVVVGMSSGAMSPITTISDREEVERLRQRYHRTSARPVPREEAPERPSFASALAEAGEVPVGEEEPLASDAPAGTTRLRDLVRRRLTGFSDTAGDPALGQALGRMREMRQRITRA